MAERYPDDASLIALSGSDDAGQGVRYPDWQADRPWYLPVYKMLYRLLSAFRRAGDLRVYKDGDLTFGVRAGRFNDGPTARTYAGASAQALADDAVNYIYLLPDGTLTVNQTGFPDPAAMPHVPLAEIAAGTASIGGVSGLYDFADLIDHRGRMMFRSLPVSRAEDLQIYKDGALTFGVRAGRIQDGSTARAIVAAAAQALVDDATNYIYLLADGTLTVNQVAFPDPAALPHVPLAEIAVGTASIGGISGAYAAEDITDHRGRAMFRVLTMANVFYQESAGDPDDDDGLTDGSEFVKNDSGTHYFYKKVSGSYRLVGTYTD